MKKLGLGLVLVGSMLAMSPFAVAEDTAPTPPTDTTTTPTAAEPTTAPAPDTTTMSKWCCTAKTGKVMQKNKTDQCMESATKPTAKGCKGTWNKM